MTRVLLIRHGETAWNREGRWHGQADVPLSEDGRREAALLARRLAPAAGKVAALYTSDLGRALETARILEAALGRTALPDPVWREFDVGVWSGLARREIPERFPDEWRRIREGEDLPRGGGETMADVIGRIARALDTVRRSHEGETVAVVTHAGVIRIALLGVLGLPPERLGDVPKAANLEVVALEWQGVSWRSVSSADVLAPVEAER